MTSLYFNDEAFTPGKILCVGRNYVEHIAELGNDVPDDMVVFNKPATAVSERLLATHGEALHFETELCFVVRDGQLAGVGIGFDLTKRQLQSQLKAKGLPWERAKAFDGAAVFSRFVALPGTIEALSFDLHIDGTLTQQGDPSLMIYSPETIVEELTQFTTLQDNDVIMTGTPKGVGEVKAGSRYVGRLFHNGQLLIEQQWTGQ